MVQRRFYESLPRQGSSHLCGEKAHENIESFKIGQTNIMCEENDTLLGVNIHFMLKFDNHVSDISEKTSEQLAI